MFGPVGSLIQWENELLPNLHKFILDLIGALLMDSGLLTQGPRDNSSWGKILIANSIFKWVLLFWRFENGQISPPIGNSLGPPLVLVKSNCNWINTSPHMPIIIKWEAAREVFGPNPTIWFSLWLVDGIGNVALTSMSSHWNKAFIDLNTEFNFTICLTVIQLNIMINHHSLHYSSLFTWNSERFVGSFLDAKMRYFRQLIHDLPM